MATEVLHMKKEQMKWEKEFNSEGRRKRAGQETQGNLKCMKAKWETEAQDI